MAGLLEIENEHQRNTMDRAPDRAKLPDRQGDSVKVGEGSTREQAQGLVPVVLELFDGAGWGGRDGFQDFESEADKGKDVSRRVVAFVGVAVLAEDDILVSMHDLYAQWPRFAAKSACGDA